MNIILKINENEFKNHLIRLEKCLIKLQEDYTARRDIFIAEWIRDNKVRCGFLWLKSRDMTRKEVITEMGSNWRYSPYYYAVLDNNRTRFIDSFLKILPSEDGEISLSEDEYRFFRELK